MTSNEGGPAIEKSRASKSTRDDRAPDHAGLAGDALEGEKPSPGDRDEISAADDPAAIDLDSAHDRAS